jgi:hypothetical protein
MPESKGRNKPVFTPPPAKSGALKPSPRWYAPAMTTLLVLGLAWVVVYYLSQTDYPIPGVGNWNLLGGFAILLLGFGMLTRWR